MPHPICAIGLAVFDSAPNSKFPSFAARFDSDLGLEIASGAEFVSLSIDPQDGIKSTLTLTAISHAECDCSPVSRTIHFETASENIRKFFVHVAGCDCFIWTVSTPSFEVKLLVDMKTERVVQKHVTERTLQ